jgi:two-component system, OmpR family, phosphate regulon sensor histidine kinase PhoR
MLTLITVLESAAILLLLWLLQAARRRQRDLRTALRTRSPYLIDASSGPFLNEWRETAAAANDLIAALRAAEAARSGQLSQIEATLGSLQEGVLAVDEANNVILANKALASLFPKAPVLLGQRIETVAHSSAFSAFLDEVRSGTAASRVELEFTSGTGASIWIEATGAVIQPWDGSRARWVLCVLHEVTRQKQLESMRKDFVANVSHELRTPLSVIKGFIETLVDGHTEIPEADRDRFLRTIQRHADRLHIILEDLLTLSRLESSRPGLRLEPTDLTKLIRELAEDYRPRATASGHTIDLQLATDAPPIAADSVRLHQVFDNLLDNALKYTPARSSIAIRTAIVASTLEIRIVDNGPGIPPKDLPHLFERFYRVDKGRSREKGGTGLGLSIVKHIVQLHGGKVWAESTLGQGTTFAVSLPLPTAESATPAT